MALIIFFFFKVEEKKKSAVGVKIQNLRNGCRVRKKKKKHLWFNAVHACVLGVGGIQVSLSCPVLPCPLLCPILLKNAPSCPAIGSGFIKFSLEQVSTVYFLGGGKEGVWFEALSISRMRLIDKEINFAKSDP